MQVIRRLVSGENQSQISAALNLATSNFDRRSKARRDVIDALST